MGRDRVHRCGSRAPDETPGGDRRGPQGPVLLGPYGLMVRDPGIDNMTGVIAGLIENGEFSEIFQRVINN